jgi:hypothetical protein
MKRTYTITLIAIFISAFFSNCSEEVGPKDVVSNTFFRQYGTPVSESNTYVGKTSTGYLMAGLSLTNDKMFISHANELGQLDWDKEIPIDRKTAFPQGVKLKDGSFIINDFNNPIITKITEKGDVLYSKWIESRLTFEAYVFSPVVESTDGFCYVSYSAGGGTYSPDFNYIAQLDPADGKVKRLIKYFDSNFGGKIVRFNIAKADSTTFWVTGNVLTGKPWSWSDPFKLFTARVTPSAVENLKVYDVGNNNVEKELATVATKDNHLVLVTSSRHFLYDAQFLLIGPSIFKVRKIDLNVNDVWEKNIDLGVKSIFPLSIDEGETGDLIITGSCVRLNDAKTSGFVVRLNSSGIVIESKIFTLGQEHLFLDAKYLPDHSYFFTGSIKNFGKGKSLDDKFYLKTDSDFNY